MNLEEKIIKVIKAHEKKNKVFITEVTAIKTREIGFGKKDEIKVDYFTKT